MPYALEIADSAAEDLERLVNTLPLHRRDAAIDAIEAACLEVAARPLKPSRRDRPPHFPLHFVVDDVHYYWAATYRISGDEKTLVITHVFRVAL